MIVTSPGVTNKMVSIASCRPHKRNYRQHPDPQLSQLGASHARFGQYRSTVLWERPGGEYVIVAGHGIIEAMRRNGVTEIRADVLAQNTPQEVIDGILVSDNLHAQNAVDDEALLSQLLQEQQDMGFDLASLGSDEEALRQMLESLGNAYLGDGQGEGEDTPQGQEQSKGSLLALLNVTIADPTHSVETGQVWSLGKHVLLCVHVFKDWAIWMQYLKGDNCLFLPFAGPLVPLSKKANSHTLVMVQPDFYIAGHILDRYAEIHGEHSLKMVKQFTTDLWENESDE